MAHDRVGETPMSYTQDQKDDLLTVTLPASAWRLISFALDSHIEVRRQWGQYGVSINYSVIRDLLRQELRINGTGDLPVDSERWGSQ